MMSSKIFRYLVLVGVNIIYACTTIFTKLASRHHPMSLLYILCVSGALTLMALYAVLWQQILRRVPLNEAYMFKGTSLVFALIISSMIFGESVVLQNIIGAGLVVVGIVLFARA